MQSPVNARVVPLLLVVALAFSLSLVDVAYASPGPSLVGCIAKFAGPLWTIAVIISWEGAGTMLPILINLYRAMGGLLVGSQQDSVSGSGSKEYTFSNVQADKDDSFFAYVQYFDSAKGDWVPNPNGIGIMGCSRPETPTVTTTSTTTLTTLSSTNVTKKETVTVGVQGEPTLRDWWVLLWNQGPGFMAGIIVAAIAFALYHKIGEWERPPSTPPPQNDDFGSQPTPPTETRELSSEGHPDTKVERGPLEPTGKTIPAKIVGAELNGQDETWRGQIGKPFKKNGKDATQPKKKRN